MFYRANLCRLRALTALVAVAPFAAATIVPDLVHGQGLPSNPGDSAQKPATEQMPAAGKTGAKAQTAEKCQAAPRNIWDQPKQENGTVGSWAYTYFGSAARAELIPEKIKTNGGGKLEGDSRKGGTSEIRVSYSAPSGPNQGFKAWIFVTPVGTYDIFEAELFLNGKPVDTMTFKSERGKAKPYAQSWDLKTLLGDDFGRIAELKNVRVAAAMDGQKFDILDADIEGTAAVVELMKTGADAYYAPYAALKACSGPQISGPGDNPESLDGTSGGSGSGGGKRCFVTTACCVMVGLGDECFELTALRRFRDRVLARSEDGRRDIRLYYEIAPLVLDEIERRGDGELLRRLYFSHILPCALAARLGLKALPRRVYRNMMAALVARYTPDRLDTLAA